LNEADDAIVYVILHTSNMKLFVMVVGRWKRAKS